jgi:hypothetical protein
MLQAVPYLDPRIRGDDGFLALSMASARSGSPQESIPHLMRDQDDGRSRTIVIPAKAGIQGIERLSDNPSNACHCHSEPFGKLRINFAKNLLGGAAF